MYSKGKFIVFEGIDGSGTTTQAQLLTGTLTSADIPFHITAEPSKGAIGSLIRKIIGGKTFTYLKEIEPERFKVILALLFTADRADHVWTELEPHWNKGEVTICDRYSLSTLAYELGVLTDKDWLQTIGRVLPTPDLTIYLCISAEEAFERLKKRWEEKGEGGAEPEIFEKLEFQKKLVSHYNTFCGHLYEDKDLVDKHNIVTIDASDMVEDVAAAVHATVMNHLRKWRLLK